MRDKIRLTDWIEYFSMNISFWTLSILYFVSRANCDGRFPIPIDIVYTAFRQAQLCKSKKIVKKEVKIPCFKISHQNNHILLKKRFIDFQEDFDDELDDTLSNEDEKSDEDDWGSRKKGGRGAKAAGGHQGRKGKKVSQPFTKKQYCSGMEFDSGFESRLKIIMSRRLNG